MKTGQKVHLAELNSQCADIFYYQRAFRNDCPDDRDLHTVAGKKADWKKTAGKAHKYPIKSSSVFEDLRGFGNLAGLNLKIYTWVLIIIQRLTLSRPSR